jgi:hypothetical protein
LSVCTITLLLAIIAADQHVPFVCVNPIGSYLLGRGGNITFGNYGCRAGRVATRRILLGPAIRAALVQKLDGDQEALRELIRTLDSENNVRLRQYFARRRYPKPTYEEEFDAEQEVDVNVEMIEDDDASDTSSTSSGHISSSSSSGSSSSDDDRKARGGRGGTGFNKNVKRWACCC